MNDIICKAIQSVLESGGHVEVNQVGDLLRIEVDLRRPEVDNIRLRALMTKHCDRSSMGEFIFKPSDMRELLNEC